MNIFAQVREHIIAVLEQLMTEGVIPEGTSFTAITAEPPRSAEHGDVATNAAMVLSKVAKKNPRELANLIVEKLEAVQSITRAEVAGPGFINVRLDPKIYLDLICAIVADGSGYGNTDIGGHRPINIEYVSANPTGPMHIGHARGAIVGDVLARLLLKAGYNITKEYYINDAGGQVDVLARSAYLRYQEARGRDIGEIPEGLYPGDYLVVVGESFAAQHEDDYLDMPEEDWLPVMREFALEAMMVMIREDLLQLGIEHDVFTSEKQILKTGGVQSAIEQLKNDGLVYTGMLEAPKGGDVEEWEAREQLLFKSTDFGDDEDRALMKSNGDTTYFASDIAYHHNKISRGFNEMIITLGADHIGYVKRLQSVVKALSNNQAGIDVLLYQLVNFMENGQPLKMSKRAGTYVTVRDVVEAVGKDVMRFIMLTRKSTETLDFDLQKVKEQSRDNPVFYVQYAHARINSVFRQAAELVDGFTEIDFGNITADQLTGLTHPSELALIQTMANWPRAVESAALTREPHRIAFYLQDLAAQFHSLWNVGKTEDNMRFIVEGDDALTLARLTLIKSCAVTLASGLDVMGIEPVTQM